jgi:SAM-dependent methyltransferase
VPLLWRGDAERIQYGLLACRCFEFPIVDGIPLLSLAKGYGGAEEELQPYVPLQVAAIIHLQRKDVKGLRAWIARHIPLADGLIEGRFGSYLEFAAARDALLDMAVVRFLARHRGLGIAPQKGQRDLAHRIHDRLRGAVSVARRLVGRPRLKNYYTYRFFAPQVNALALQLEQLPLDGRLLSLCCGHGVYENLLLTLGGQHTVVSIDGQFLNLLCTRRFISPRGVYLCHDLQFPLPFVDGTFDGVFSSRCLPEIPAQQTFVREAIRATADTGWTLFDSIWSLDSPGVRRIDQSRHFRFCQNQFSHVEDYLSFFMECAGPERSIAVDVPGLPTRYLEAPPWITEPRKILEAVSTKTDDDISVLITNPGRFGSFKRGSHKWLSTKTLAVSPVFDVKRADNALRLVCKPGFSKLGGSFAPNSFMGYPDSMILKRASLSEPNYCLEQFCDSVFVPLPRQFARDTESVGSLLTKI